MGYLGKSIQTQGEIDAEEIMKGAFNNVHIRFRSHLYIGLGQSNFIGWAGSLDFLLCDAYQNFTIYLMIIMMN